MKYIAATLLSPTQAIDWPGRAHTRGRAAGLKARVSRALAQWHARARQRQQLALLDDGMLHDIGVSRVEAETESRKPFWRA